MQRGVRRGALPDEEIEWLECHIYCDSINQLFRDYSEQFGSPYSTIDSFRAILHRYSIYPIIKTVGYDNVNRMLELMIAGDVHWEYTKGSNIRGRTGEPHWLWRWHTCSYRQPTGVSFRPYPKRLKERTFEESVHRDDTL